MPKWNQNGRLNRPKITKNEHQKQSEIRAQKYAKMEPKWLPKLIENDTQNRSKNSMIFNEFWVPRMVVLGGREGPTGADTSRLDLGGSGRI